MKKLTPVFFIAVLIAIAFILWGVIAPQHLDTVTSNIQGFITEQFGWFYLLAASGFLGFAIFLIFSRYGKIKLGKDDDEPEYNFLTWFSFLFTAGMGIGLVFWGVAEPMNHFYAPPTGDPESTGAASAALTYSFFHWGLHPWAIYTIVALALAYFKFRLGAPGVISAVFHPLLGDRVKGPIGTTIDVIVVFATIFGVATSLGLGTAQIAGGAAHIVPGISNTIWTQMIIIIIVTILYMLSSLTGLNKGIRILSKTNIYLAIALLLFLLFAGPTNFIMNVFTQTIGSYIQNLVGMSFRLDPFDPETSWVQGWTIFYWAWWIAWAPFVGSFIARVSRGRTIREFVIGVLAVPTVFGALWFSVFGGTAISLDLYGNGGIMEVINTEGMEMALFSVLQQFPLGTFMSIVAVLLIASFFITSADSATFVLGMQTTNGSLYPPNSVKIIWGIIQSAAAAVLLWSGGLNALQTASIIAAFPFAIIMIFMIISLVIALRKEITSTKKHK
ncbi:glycine betaine uptake BCCT transporter [Desertibacillus haloalkaliphilus]|uniref:glycine betaine uptake BCCT transporter n=1 Tax=Desertibacillus haloalkaliphilus TaxID=1328930 RepID=UPI001C263F7D|nr:BCCT family transporter [Desertibacillus haloalkaliphilus]MBU8906750.1 BCCT family transporter [Desertibacillus haloalkaliphilus]